MHNLLLENIRRVYCNDKLSKSNSFVNKSNINAARADSNAAMINMFKYIKISFKLSSTDFYVKCLWIDDDWDYNFDEHSYIKRRRYDVAEQL